ncbi:MAG: hypothetical protein Q4E69_00890 [Bacilli bacterium]|nr:hypothetical protein [Bacilli bacterium]
MNIEETIKNELELIKNDRIKTACLKIVKLLPEYWFTVAAASTGKYHPEYAQGEGGLLRHSKAAMRIGYELLNDPVIGDKYTDDEKDLMLVSLLVHDGLKLGNPKEKYTRFDHPILMAKYLEEKKDELSELTPEEITFMGDVIKTHMGPWTTDYDGNEVLERPTTKYQNFVHMCDYLASRKCLLVPFDENNNITA